MNRRHFIQALGFTGTAALAAGSFRNAASLFAAEGEAFPMTTVNHLSISVADFAKTRDWYVDLFGMRVTWDNGKESGIEFGPANAPNAIYIDPAKPGEKASVTHIGFGIPDFWAKKDAMKAEMDRRGVKGVRPDGEAGWSCNTPSGYLVQPVPVADEAMYPGAGGPCKVAKSDACVAGFEEGHKILATLSKASGKGFKAVAFSRIVFHTPDMAADRDFFRDLWGMKVISDKEDGDNAECLLKFGENTLCLRKTAQPADKPNSTEFSFQIEDFNKSKVEAELKRRGLNPVMDPEMGWVVSDLDGLRVGVTGKV
jgi:catechol 2,3-dioxygenase-like lactoylglutathione lyase family enzyme